MRVREIRTPGEGPYATPLRPGRGLVGWVGGSSRERQAARELLLESFEFPDPERGEGAGRHPELTPRALAMVWAGGPGADAATLLAEGARIVARVGGLWEIEEALSALGQDVSEDLPTGGVPASPTSEGEAEDAEARAELREVRSRLEELRDVPERLRTLEEELRALRADAAEMSGDVEAATMDWLRERQDAETQLSTYRDRARELRDRIREMEESGPDGPCPFCGRTLGSHHAEVLSELRDEWERLVQDGSWWRKRREQLELKPARVRELEGGAVRLQAAVEECAERLERCRFDLRERDELRGRLQELEEVLGRSGASPQPDGEDVETGPAEKRRRRLVDAFRAVHAELLDREEAELARRAGDLLNRITGGRLLGLRSAPEGPPLLLEDGRPLPSSTGEDRAAAVVALRVALALRTVESGVPLESLLLDDVVRDLDPGARLRAVEVLKGLVERIPQILVVAGDEVVDAAPERFDRVVEFRRDPPAGAPPFRVRPAGVGRIRLVAAGD